MSKFTHYRKLISANMEFRQRGLVTVYLCVFSVLSSILHSCYALDAHEFRSYNMVEMKEIYSKLNANDILTSLFRNANVALRSTHQQTN